jgi:hypothetical protein
MKHKSDRRQDGWMAAGLFAFTFLSRVPFCSRILYHWDSVNFAYAMRELDIAKEQPHPPGYILYVWLCRAVDLVFNDAQNTMVWISVVASALGVVALFFLGRSMFGRRTGLIAALFLATSPLFWFYGEIALPHTLDTLLVIVSVWWLYETMQGDIRYLYPAVALLAVAGGVRQQTIVFLAPALLFALRRVGWKRFVTAGMLGAAICVAWFIPLMVANGGFANYMRVMGEFSNRFQSTTSVLAGAGLPGVGRNLRRLIMYTLYGWSVVLVPAVAYACIRLGRREWPQRWERPVFLSLWVVPVLAFYTLIHMGQQGLVFVFLPALLLFSAVGLARLLAARTRRLAVAAAILVGVNACVFCLGPEYPLGPGNQRLLTRATVVNSDHYYLDRFGAITRDFPRESTAILAANWHHVEYYLPAYKLLRMDVTPAWGLGGSGQASAPQEEETWDAQTLALMPDADGGVNIVIFDDELAPLNGTPGLAQTVGLAHGGRMEAFELSAGQVLYVGQNFGVREP